MNRIILPQDEVISAYKQTYSVSQVLKHFGYPRGNSERRAQINQILKDADIFEGNSGPNVARKKQERIEKTSLERYGVKNFSLTKEGRNNLHNHREKTSLPLVEEFRIYQSEVNRQTKKNVRKIKDRPERCEYLGVEFVDDAVANPNDHFKRTIDHKKSIYSCWLDGVSVQEAAGLDNLAWVCRYVNSIKGNCDYEDIKHIFAKIKEKLGP